MTDLLDRLAALDPVSTGITEKDTTSLRASVADRIDGGTVKLRPTSQIGQAGAVSPWSG